MRTQTRSSGKSRWSRPTFLEVEVTCVPPTSVSPNLAEKTFQGVSFVCLVPNRSLLFFRLKSSYFPRSLRFNQRALRSCKGTEKERTFSSRSFGMYFPVFRDLGQFLSFSFLFVLLNHFFMVEPIREGLELRQLGHRHWGGSPAVRPACATCSARVRGAQGQGGLRSGGAQGQGRAQGQEAQGRGSTGSGGTQGRGAQGQGSTGSGRHRVGGSTGLGEAQGQRAQGQREHKVEGAQDPGEPRPPGWGQARAFRAPRALVLAGSHRMCLAGRRWRRC